MAREDDFRRPAKQSQKESPVMASYELMSSGNEMNARMSRENIVKLR